MSYKLSRTALLHRKNHYSERQTQSLGTEKTSKHAQISPATKISARRKRTLELEANTQQINLRETKNPIQRNHKEDSDRRNVKIGRTRRNKLNHFRQITNGIN